jgi:hypothetical protein
MATAVDSSADAAFTVGAATHAVRLAASTAVAAGFMAALSPTAVEASTVAVEGSTAVAEEGFTAAVAGIGNRSFNMSLACKTWKWRDATCGGE